MALSVALWPRSNVIRPNYVSADRPVEGQVNRIKMLKRQMFGRANLDLLRIRVLHRN